MKQKDRHPDAAHTAHLIIDAHRAFCDPAYKNGYGTADTLAAARKIESLTEHFRRAGIKNYFISLPRIHGLFTKLGALLVTPRSDDIKVWKWHDSGFRSGRIDSYLRKQDIRTLLISGFNRASCVLQTAKDAREKSYEVYVIMDASADDKRFVPHKKYRDWAVKTMEEKGICMISTKEALQLFPPRP